MFSKTEFYMKKLKHEDKVKNRWLKGIQKKITLRSLTKALKKAQTKAIKKHTDVITLDMMVFPTDYTLPAKFLKEVELFTNAHVIERFTALLKDTEWVSDRVDVKTVIQRTYVDVYVSITPAESIPYDVITLCAV